MISSAHHHDLAITVAADGSMAAVSFEDGMRIVSACQSQRSYYIGTRKAKSRKKAPSRAGRRAVMLSLLSAPATAAACISLQGSTTCPAFQSASISTNSYLVGLFSFLQFVSDRSSFDSGLESYLMSSYIHEKYQSLLGCGNINLNNTTELYARFTATVICNAIVQNSISDCSLSKNASRPVCAETCAQFAESEAYLVSNSELCSSSGDKAATQIRADFTNCALPANSLSSGNCIEGIANESNNCGYGNSTIGLCSYCASGGINSTDTCCYSSNASKKCMNVVLPSLTTTMVITTGMPSATALPSAAASAASGGNNDLSRGAIAGIVIGAVLGALLLVFLLFMCISLIRRKRGSQDGSIFNQPSPARKGQLPKQIKPATSTPQSFQVLPGGRIARMSALEGRSGESTSRQRGRDVADVTLAGAAAGYPAEKKRSDESSSDGYYGDSPGSDHGAGILRPPPRTTKRTGSLSSNSVLVGAEGDSLGSTGGMSPPGIASPQSEQLPFFKDYYSQDDIRPGDRVAVLWAYQPRAADEFSLERGDMLKVVGIWDDGWATGVLTNERAGDWESRRQAQRDSGVFNTSGRAPEDSPSVSGEIKAFPLVCVCLPEHWRKTIEGDGSTETGSSARPQTKTTA